MLSLICRVIIGIKHNYVKIDTFGSNYEFIVYLYL